MNRGEVKTRTHPPSQSVLLSCLISSHSKHFSVNNSRLQAKYHQYDGSSCLCRPLVWTLLDCMVDGWLVAGMFYVPTEREVLKCVKLNKHRCARPAKNINRSNHRQISRWLTDWSTDRLTHQQSDRLMNRHPDRSNVILTDPLSYWHVTDHLSLLY